MIQRLQLSPDPDRRRDADCEVQVRGFGSNRLSQQVVNSHRTPLTLTCPERKQSRPQATGGTNGMSYGNVEVTVWTRNPAYTVSGSARELPVSSPRSRVLEPFVSCARSTDTTRHTSASEVTPAAAFASPSASSVVMPPRCAAAVSSWCGARVITRCRSASTISAISNSATRPRYPVQLQNSHPPPP